MNVNKLTLTSSDFPEVLKKIPTPPQKLYVLGDSLSELLLRPCVAIVGSRRVSTYGRHVTEQLAGALARAGVVIVSGLALGVDGIAHQAALDAGGLTIAVLPGGVDHIHPRSHYHLAQRIVAQGGAVLSEHPTNTPIYRSSFVIRNRITAGLSQAVLITEASQRSGTLSTARFALEQGREVLAVPGNITSATSIGTNTLIKNGATPVTDVADVFHVLGITNPYSAPVKQAPQGSTPQEQTLLDLLFAGITEGDELLIHSKLSVSAYNQALTMLEITGQIRALGSNAWALS